MGIERIIYSFDTSAEALVNLVNRFAAHVSTASPDRPGWANTDNSELARTGALIAEQWSIAGAIFRRRVRVEVVELDQNRCMAVFWCIRDGDQTRVTLTLEALAAVGIVPSGGGAQSTQPDPAPTGAPGPKMKSHATAIQRLVNGQSVEDVKKQWIGDYELEKGLHPENTASGADELFRKSVLGPWRKM